MSLTQKQKQSIYQNIGCSLRLAREERNLDLDEAASLQNMRVENLKQLEDGSMSKLANKPLGRLISMFANYYRLMLIDAEPFVPQKTYVFTDQDLMAFLAEHVPVGANASNES